MAANVRHSSDPAVQSRSDVDLVARQRDGVVGDRVRRVGHGALDTWSWNVPPTMGDVALGALRRDLPHRRLVGRRAVEVLPDRVVERVRGVQLDAVVRDGRAAVRLGLAEADGQRVGVARVDADGHVGRRVGDLLRDLRGGGGPRGPAPNALTAATRTEYDARLEVRDRVRQRVGVDEGGAVARGRLADDRVVGLEARHVVDGVLRARDRRVRRAAQRRVVERTARP